MNEKKLGLMFFLVSGVVISAVVVVFFVFKPNIAVWTDNKIYDTFLRGANHSAIGESTVIIDIDDDSIRRLGQWPWSRYILAEILANLTNSGVSAIGIDILLSESDRSSPRLIKENLFNIFGIDVAFKDLPEDLYDNDIAFTNILSQTPTVLGMYMNFVDNESINGIPKHLNIAVLETQGAKTVESQLLTASSVTAALPMFHDAVKSAYINALSDSDGIMRKVPLLMALQTDNVTKLYPSLAVGALAIANRTETVVVKTDEGGLVSLRIGKLTIPVEADGSFYVKFKGGGRTYKYISAADIFLGNFDAKDIAGKIAFVGSSAPGLLDIRNTPLDNFYPGIEIHASVVDNIATGNFMSIPVWSPGLQVILIFALGIYVSLMLSRVSIYAGLPLATLLLVAIWFACSYFFNKGYFVSPLYLSIVIVIESVTVLSAQFIFESRQKRRIKSAFSRYVSPVVVSQIADMGIDVFKGTAREVTAMFTDIRGFTTISEKLAPEQVVEMLNRYFTPMTALIKNSGGTLDKFIGDAIVAFWNAPLDVKDHPKKAIEVGLEMQTELTKLNVSLMRDYGITLKMGAGVNTGNVYVGNMGSSELLDYTIIGDNVNLTSRLEGLCSKYGITLVVSEYSIIGYEYDYYFMLIDRITVKGKTKPISAYFPIRHLESEERAAELEMYREASDLYMHGNFLAAKDIFTKLVENFTQNDTHKLYSIYLERCIDMEKNPPEHWEGVWEYTSK